MQYQQMNSHPQMTEDHETGLEEVMDENGVVQLSEHNPMQSQHHHPHHNLGHHAVMEPSLHHPMHHMTPEGHLGSLAQFTSQAAQLVQLQQQQQYQALHHPHTHHHLQHPHAHPLHAANPHAHPHLQHPDYDSQQIQHQIDNHIQSNLHLNNPPHLGDPNDPHSHAHRLHHPLDASEAAAHYQHTLEKQVAQMEHDAGVHDLTEGGSGGKKRKHGNNNNNNNNNGSDKSGHFNVCLALGCERQIKQRRLCPMHQKQKERSGGKIELKENVKFTKGRTPTPFSKHANKYAKLKTFDKKIDEWAGGKEEGTLMLDAYLESSYHQSRFPKQEDSKIYEQIGRNIVDFMKQLPEKSPLRRPLIKAMSEGVPLARLREVLPVSKQTVINSKKLPDQDNLLLTIKYKPNVTRNRKRLPGGMDMGGSPLSPQQVLGGDMQGMGQGGQETIVNAVVANDELGYPSGPQMGVGVVNMGGSMGGNMGSMGGTMGSSMGGGMGGMSGMSAVSVTPQLNSLNAPLNVGVVS